MFEITFKDKEKLSALVRERKAYKNAEYDFTFENKFYIYHAPTGNKITYYALDKDTGLGSAVTEVSKERMFSIHNFTKLIPFMLFSIKYSGDKRYNMTVSKHSEHIIEYVFRVILPSYGYIVRDEQIKLSLAMYDGLANKDVAICEAEVGTGKTLSFLVAAIVAKMSGKFAFEDSFPITIATSNIELQRSLIEKDIPNLSKMLEDFKVLSNGINAVLRKGKEHYFCRMRYDSFLGSLKDHPIKHKNLIRELEKLESGEVLDLDTHELRPYVKDKICVHCCKSDCKYKRLCRYHAFLVRSRSNFLDVQVTNHNQYLMNLKTMECRPQMLLQKSDFVIIDEAHKLKDAAQDVFGTRLEKNELSEYLEEVKNGSFEETRRNYHNVAKRIREYEEKLFKLLELKARRTENEDERDNIINLGDEELDCLTQLIFDLKLLGEFQVDGIESPKSLVEKIEPFLSLTENLIWVTEDENGLFSLNCTPKEIGRVLYNKVWSKGIKHVLTSGTMSDGENFDYFKRLNGLNYLNSNRILEHRSLSPFDYASHARLYIPKDIPFPENDSKEYISAVADRIEKIIEATHGHTTILFTSYKLLMAVYEIVKPKISKYEVFAMTKRNRTIISDFKKSKNGVLFASGSMWEGVDCIGDCLSSVIIVRLPFPLRTALMETKKQGCKDTLSFVKEYAIPEMIIKLRQGVGRLIRCESDTGLVTILDSRALNASYSSKIDKVLGKYPRIYGIEEIHDFFKTIKPEQYFED